MATAAQLEANRKNSLHSTGPKTPEGKARAATNATDHGFRTTAVLLPTEDPAEYEALVENLSNHFNPEDLTEERDVREMTDAEWRLRRARRLLHHIQAAKIDELRPQHADPIALEAAAFIALADHKGYQSLLKYEAKFERQYNQAYRHWGRYQDDQRAAEKRQDPIAQLAKPASAGTRPNLTPCVSAGTPTATNEPNSPPAELRANANPSSIPPGVSSGNANLTNEPNSTPRNAPCPCGSREKYKRCCGKNAPPVLHRVA